MRSLACIIIDKITLNRDLRLPDERSRIAFMEGWTSIFSNFFLAALKLIFGFLSGSISLIADGVHTVSDIASSAIILIGFKIAKKQPDQEHPFGHGRAEYLTGLIVGIMLLGAGVAIIINSYERLEAGTVMEPSIIAVGVVVFSILFKEFLYHFSYCCGEAIDSEALIADAIHHRSDSLSSVAVLIALVCAFFQWGNLDAIFGFLVSAFILHSGLKIIIKSCNCLLGEAPTNKTSEEIYRSVLAIDGVMDAHDLIVHDYGAKKSVSIHIEVDKDISLKEAHLISHNVEKNINEENKCHAVVHVDPIIVSERKNKMQKAKNKIRNK